MKASTVYQKEFHWTRSPEVWGTLIKVFFAGVFAGVVLCLLVQGMAEEEGKTPKPTTSQSAVPGQQP